MFYKDGDPMDVCIKCKGHCCKDGAPTVSSNELLELPDPMYKYVGNGLWRPSINGVCQFLSGEGCTLDKKPLACEIYPFYPSKNISQQPTWVLKASCLYWQELGEEDLEEAKLAFEESNEFRDYNV